MDLSKYNTYMQSIAEKHKEIAHSETNQHFCRMDLDSIVTASKLDLESPCMILENYSGGFSDLLSDNVREIQECAFLMLVQCIEKNDEAERTQAIDKSKELADDALSKMLNDTKKRVIPKFEPDSIRFATASNLFNGWYGVRVEFTLNDKANIAFNESKWHNETKFSI